MAISKKMAFIVAFVLIFISSMFPPRYDNGSIKNRKWLFSKSLRQDIVNEYRDGSTYRPCRIDFERYLLECALAISLSGILYCVFSMTGEKKKED